MEENIKRIQEILKYKDDIGIPILGPRDYEAIEHLLEDYKELRQENRNLKEKLENYIPRRRVRRIYKQVKKILEQDGIVDDLESEEKDE